MVKAVPDVSAASDQYEADRPATGRPGAEQRQIVTRRDGAEDKAYPAATDGQPFRDW